jgi:hypothetical protein
MADSGHSMNGQPLLLLDKVFLELRYAPSLLYHDFTGTIAHSAKAVFPEVEVGLTEVLVHEGTADDPRMRIGPSLAWFSPTEGTPFPDFLRWVRSVADRVLVEILAVEELDRVGVRAYSLLPMATVEEGVTAFREAVTDHYGPPFSVLSGEPSGVRLELRLSKWETIENLDIDLTAFLAPVKLPPSVEERLSETHPGPWQGGLLLDLDAATAEGQAVGVTSGLELAAAMADRLSATVKGLVKAIVREDDGLPGRAEGE